MHVIPAAISIVRTPSMLRKLFKSKNLPLMKGGADSFLSNNSELVPKYQAVVKYLNKPETSPKEVITDRIGDYLIHNLYDNKVVELLELCGDDLSKIDQLLGLYGLAEYAEVKPETIIKNRNPEVKEGRYSKDSPFRESFYWYLLANENGDLDDLYSRFGKMGRSLYKDCSMLGFVKTGSRFNFIDIGKEALSEDLSSMSSAEAKEDIEALFGSIS